MFVYAYVYLLHLSRVLVRHTTEVLNLSSVLWQKSLDALQSSY